MNATPATDTFRPGDVIEDSYGNPAVVIKVDANGRPDAIMQACGSDRGHQTYVPRTVVRVTDDRAEWAREIARAEWRRGNRW